jgi:hypothetical protein
MHTTRFGNNLHQVRSKSKDWKGSTSTEEQDDNGYTITSGMGNLCDWYGSFTKLGEFLTAFRLQVEPIQVRY